MKTLAFAAVFLALALVFVACQTPPVLEPAVGPGTDYPCGVHGVVCLTLDGKPNGGCCSEGETCGGGKYDVGCPAGCAATFVRRRPGRCAQATRDTATSDTRTPASTETRTRRGPREPRGADAAGL